MTSCAQSYGSFSDDEQDALHHIPIPRPPTFPSYAAAVSSTAHTTSNNPNQPPRPRANTKAAPFPRDVEVTGYRSTIATLQQDVTIVNLQAEIKLL